MVLLAAVALFLAYLEWNYQVNAEQALEGLQPPGVETTPFDWDQARSESRVRMVFALIAGVASAVAGVLLLRSREHEALNAA